MTQATDDVFYLYVGNGWSGPFRLEQIRLFVKEKQISDDTFAFEPQQQMQLTVAQLLADPTEAATGSYQSPTAPKGGAGKSTRLDAYDAKQTVVSGRGPQTTIQKGAATQRHDDDVIDLDAVAIAATGKAAGRKQDDDVIDLDAVPTSATNKATVRTGTRRPDDEVIDLDAVAGSASGKTTVGTRADDEVIDLDAPRKGDLSVEIDEPAGRPADSTHGGKPYQPQPGSQEALEVVLGELENLRRAYNSLMENSIKDREDAQGRVHVAHLAINEVLEERKSDIAEIRSLVAEIDLVTTELAKKHRDQTLSTRIIRLRDSLHDSDVAQMVQGAEAVLRRIVEQFDRVKGKDKAERAEDPFSAFDAKEAAPDLANAQAQLAELRKAYDTLHEQLTKEQQTARERLLSATALLENERQKGNPDNGETRALAGEIYRLACEIDPQWLPRPLYQRVQGLYEELSKPEPTAASMAPVANDVLLGMVGELKARAERQGAGDSRSETAALRKQVKELGSLRAELLQTRTDLGVMKQREQALQEEKARLQLLLDDQKLISEKAQQAAKAREQRLRSTVTALEVTKELHQEVMRDLQSQLASAQGKVEEMEQELKNVRGELTSRRDRKKGDDLNAEMRRVIEMRAMLDARKQELSADLKSTEAELQRVNSEQAEDHELAEMLAAKVNHLRQTYEQTLKRLGDQESKAQSLQAELDASRREAGELRGRSDGLNAELESARSNLSSAKKRVEELHLAYQRLESERESLQQELTQRKSTTTVFRAGVAETAPPPAEDAADPAARLAEVTLRAETLESELARERRALQDLVNAHEALQARVIELTADRDQLRAELDKLAEERQADQQHHAAAAANATQAAIEAETRLNQAKARIAELEAAPGAAGANPAELERLRAELAEAKQQAKSAVGLLNDARAAVAAAGSQTTDQRASELVERLAEAEKDIEAAANQRDQVQAQLGSAVAEAERLRRELESAANEHRAALTSARGRLAQEQERGESLEREVAELRAQAQAQASQRESVNVALAQAISAKDRMAAEVERLQTEIGARSGVSESRAAELAAARAELETARKRIVELEARQAALEQESAQSLARAPELEAKLARSQAERQQLLGELDRLRGELVTVAQTRSQSEAERAELIEGRRLLAEADAERSRLRAQARDANAELDRLRAELAELAARESAQGEALAQAESRLAVESTRSQEADRLLADARSQFHAVSDERDRARLELAQSEAQRKTLESQLERLRGELDRLKARAQGTGSTDMHTAADQARIETLENELIDAQRKLRDLELRETQRLAMMTAERDQLSQQLQELTTRYHQLEQSKALAGDSKSRERLLERQLADERARGESTAQEATQALERLRAVTLNYRRLELEHARGAGSASAATGPDTVQRARLRLEEIDARRAAALGPVGDEGGARLPLSGETTDRLGALTPSTAGATPAASADRQTTAATAFAQTFRYPSGTVWTNRVAPAPTTVLVPRPPQKPFAKHRLTLIWTGIGAAATLGYASLVGLSNSLPTSSSAVVNATITSLAAQVDGTAERPLCRVGDIVEAGDTLLTVRKPKPDGGNLASLQRRSAELAGMAASLDRLIASNGADLADAERRRSDEHERGIEEARRKLADAEQALSAAEEASRAKAAVLSVLEPLRQQTKIEPAVLDSIRRDMGEAAKTATQKREAVDVAKRHLAEIEANRVLGDPQIDGLRADLDAQKARLTTIKSEIASNEEAIQAENKRLAEPTDVTVRATTPGIVWKRRAVEGQSVRAGEPICDLADPESIVIEAIVNERHSEDLHVGDSVRVKLMGGHTVVSGTVTHLLPTQADPEQHVKTLKASANSVRLAIAIGPELDAKRFLGQTAEVVVLGSDPGAATRFLGWLHFKLH